MGYQSGWGEPFKGPSMKNKVKYPNLGRGTAELDFAPDSYANISSSHLGELASGNAPKFGLTPGYVPPTQSVEGTKPSFHPPEPFEEWPRRDTYTWDEFGNPMSMLQLALAGQLGRASTINQRADLQNKWLQAYEDIDRSSIIGERNLRDTLNQRNVWNSGIKERDVGELSADKLKFLGRADLAKASGQRDIDLAKQGYDFQYDLGRLLEGARGATDHRAETNKVRSDMADRIKAMSN